MPIDSTADLLFRIGANTDDAEGNIARFRSLLGTDLGEMGAQFKDWSTGVFGDLSTVQGAVLGMTAALAAGVVAVAAAAGEAAHKYSDYVTEVERGSRATGISLEKMSGLKFAAEETGTSYDSLVTGLTRFASTVVKAAAGGEQQMEMFKRLGISQEQVKAGEKDMGPLLEQVADRFHGLGSQVEKTAVARELFSRGGAALVRMLSLGSEGLREFEREAAKLGLTVGQQDVVEVEKFRLTTKATEAQMEALSLEIGKFVLPVFERFKVGVLAVAIGLKDLPKALHGDWWASWKEDMAEAGERIDKLSHALANLPAEGEGLGDPEKIAKVREEWTGLVDVLERVKDASKDTFSVDDRTAKDFEKLQDEIGKAERKYDELRAAGKLTAEDAAQEAAALRALPAALSALLTHQIAEINQKNLDAQQDLFQRIIGQQKATTAQRMALWDAEIEKLREKLAKEKALTAGNLELLAQLERAGYDRIGREATDAVTNASERLDAKIEQLSEHTYEQKRAAWNREIDAETAADAKAEALTAANVFKLVYLRKAGLDKIAADARAAGAAELARLGEQLARTERAHETTAQRIVSEYQAELGKYVAAEEKKTLALAVGEAQRAQIVAMYAAIRKGLLDKETADLQAVLNSQGWQGVFGAKFAETIRGNEALLKQWQTSTNQAAMMVKVTLEGLKEAGQQTFEGMAQGMGANIASAIVYQKSLGEAMRAAVASTLESLAARAMTYAIYSTALGFLRLAEWDPVGADAAFTSAAIWASVGAASAVAGRYAAGKQASGGGASAGGGTGPGATENAAAGKDMQAGAVPATAAAAGGSHVTVNVWGHVVGTSGVGELCDMLNDAVLNSDHTLTATNTKTGVQVTR